MTSQSGTSISFGVQAGDKKADEVVRPHYMRLRRLLAECDGGCSGAIRELAPVLRIDGSIWHWDRRGHDNVSVEMKSGHATVDVFMPIDVWHDGDSVRIRKYLADHVRSAIDSLAREIEQLGIPIDHEALIACVDRKMNEFLAS